MEEIVNEQQQEQHVPGCTGNCKQCAQTQRIYCAAQIGYYMQNIVTALSEQVKVLSESVVEMSVQVSALLASEQLRAAQAEQLIMPDITATVFPSEQQEQEKTSRKTRKKS